MPPDICPNCGAEVPNRARACPECGADEKTGWSDDAVGARLGLPDEEFNYNEFVEKEFNSRPRAAKRSRLRWYYLIAAVLLVLMLLGVLRFR